MRAAFVAIVVLIALQVSVAGAAKEPQSPPPAAAVPPAQPAATEGGRVPPPPEGYSYRPEGRRDPFLSLAARSADPRSTGKRAEGLPGLLVSEVALRGVIQAQGRYLATVQAPDMKSYLVRPGDRFFDGVVKAITADSLIIMVEVNDPLSLTKQREVRKTLRLVEEVK
jgi:Tfp pilus assembly protein PilP